MITGVCQYKNVRNCIVSDLQENLLSKNGLKLKVKSFPECTVDDMFFNIVPILKKTSDYLILHVGTNDSLICRNRR